MKFLTLVFTLPVLLVVMATSAAADGLQDHQLVDILKANGYHHAQIEHHGTIKIEKGQDIYYLYNTFGGDLKIVYFNRASANATYARMNQWNEGERYSVAYITTQNHRPAVAANLHTDAGLNTHRIKDFVHRFEKTVIRYKQFVASHANTGGH